MKTQTIRFSSFAVGLMALSACQQDPYPKLGLIQPSAIPSRVVPTALSIATPAKFDFVEGKLAEYTFEYSVPTGRTGILELLDAPAGVKFDPVQAKISWTPTQEQGGKPVQGYDVRIRLRDGVDALQVTERVVTLLVLDVPRANSLRVGNLNPQLKETSPFTTTVNVISPDYPTEEFNLNVSGDLQGIAVKRKGPQLFEVSYTPPATLIKRTSTTADFDVEYVAVGPNGATASTSDKWRVADTRINPSVSAPSTLSQGMSASFAIRAVDLNDEAAPLISAPTVPFGKLVATPVTETPVAGQSSNVTSINYSWQEIPADRASSTSTLTFNVCVYSGGFGSQNQCTKQAISVTFSAQRFSPPSIDRAAWPLGKTLYLIEGGAPLTVSIPVKDGDNRAEVPSVSVQDASQSGAIKFAANTVTVDSKKVGNFQFNLKAVSFMGSIEVQSFSVEVLPKNWASTIVFGDRKSDPEVAQLMKLIPDAQLVNPVLQASDPRTFVLRKRLVIGTSALIDAEQKAQVEALALKVPHVLIHSPLVGKIQGELAKVIANSGISIRTRLGDLATPPKLADITVLGVGALNPLSTKLSGKLTSESASPAIVEAAFSITSSCSTLLKYDYPANATSWGMGVTCTSASTKGTITVFGTELGDLDFATGTTQKQLTQWLSTKWGN